MNNNQDERLSTDDLAGATARTEVESARGGRGADWASGTEGAGSVVPSQDRGPEPAGGMPRAEAGDDVALPQTDPAGSVLAEQRLGLFPPEQAEVFRNRWAALQAQFVDDPERAVRDSDALVAEVMQTLAASFAQHKSELEGQWTGGDVHTEGLRQAFHRYRAFFQGLLSA